MNHPLGSSRNVVKERHALFTPNGFVPSVLPGWTNCVACVLISPALGAKFAQTSITLERNGRGAGATGESELFAYVIDGKCSINGHALSSGNYAYLPPGSDYDFRSAKKETRLLLFQKRYEPLASKSAPNFFTGDAADIAGAPFLGDPHARLQVLLPDNASFDMAVNIFSYDPGAALPFVETHVMEHGLLMLAGAGVYRLESEWYPVQAGDVIWMAPFCPQWFVALGSEPAVYIYYKDVNRSPL